MAAAAVLAWPQAQPSPPAKPPVTPTPSPSLVLLGGTVIDVSEWGHSAKDLSDSIVIVRDGRITDVGSRFAIPVPKGSRIIDCTGKYIVPGLVDGFAGMSSQGEASANLYMGVTTVVASSDDRRGLIDFTASPAPHLYLVDSVGTTDSWSSLAKNPDWEAKLKEGARPAELSPQDTARQIVDTLPSNPERHAAIEQILRAKDSAVRALLFKMLEVGPHTTPAEYRVALDAAQKAARERGDTV